MALKNSSKTSSNNTLMMVILGVLLASVMGMFAYIVMNNVGAKKQDSASAETAVKTQPAAQTPVTAQVNGQDRVGMAIGEFKGEIPKVISLLDSLKGFKEDPSVKPEDTVYIIYDPRCPYCHGLFDKIHNEIDLKQKKITVKWLPSVALGAKGDNDPVIARAAHGLVAKNLEEFSNSFANKPIPDVKVTDQMKVDLNDNLEFLYEASNRTFGESASKSVPAVFFLDKQTGVPQMMYGASDDTVFKNIFGE
jgi:hypothetical protein